jgi:hypothetical protein
MRALTAQDILLIWELALQQHPVDRAITILDVAYPELPADVLASLSMGRRNAYLLAARTQTFGANLSCVADCPACQERLEYALDVSAMQAMASTEVINQEYLIQAIQGYELRFRLPNSLDLAAIAVCQDVAAARTLLVQRCVVQACREGEEVTVEALPDTLVSELAVEMTGHDALAEMLIDLTCLQCHHSWQVVLDIGAFFWSEICAEAKRLLREVHTLAQAYGWHEVDILSMSAARRQSYLEMVS